MPNRGSTQKRSIRLILGYIAVIVILLSVMYSFSSFSNMEIRYPTPTPVPTAEPTPTPEPTPVPTPEPVRSIGPGGYTTGVWELDDYLQEALEKSGAINQTGEEALKTIYLYIKNNYQYLVTPEDTSTEANGATGWETERALRFFKHDGGTCYGYAAALGFLFRCMGEEAYIVAAQINQYYEPHAFVIIKEGDIDWIYDVEMEDARPQRHADLGLFHIKNFTIYNYWYEQSYLH